MNIIGYFVFIFCYAHIKTIQSWPAVCYVMQFRLVYFVRYINISLYINLESVEIDLRNMTACSRCE